MSKEISQLIMIEVKPGQRDEQIIAYSKLAPLVLAERGCLEYDLKAIEGNENKFVLLEKWTSEKALEFHDNTEYMKKADSLNHIFRAKPAEVIRLVDLSMNYQIQLASLINAEKLAFIVSNSNRDVAEKFEITFENNPKHPSFYTKEWVLKDIERGEKYFIYQESNEYLGCVAFEQPNTETAYLNRLSVLPTHRCNGIGEKLVNHIFEYSKEKSIKTISIGIISKHEQLKAWYLKLGFIKGETKDFSHLPFDVTFMHYEL